MKKPTHPPTPKGPLIHCAHDRMADIATLVANPRNPQIHPEAQVALLARIIAHQGWRSPIVVSRRSGFVVAGHGRLLAARKLGLVEGPVNDQDFATEADEWAHLLADNRLSALAETDEGLLRGLVVELQATDLDLNLTGFDEAALGELLNISDAVEAVSKILNERWSVCVDCSGEPQQQELFDRFTKEGLTCRLLTL